MSIFASISRHAVTRRRPVDVVHIRVTLNVSARKASTGPDSMENASVSIKFTVKIKAYSGKHYFVALYMYIDI